MPLERDCGSWTTSRVDPSSSNHVGRPISVIACQNSCANCLRSTYRLSWRRERSCPSCAEQSISTPVVFGYSGDPVEAGLVNSFSRPGGNFTGATFMSYEVNAKRVELLHEAFPHVTRVAILSNPLHPGEQRELKESEHGAQRLGMGLSYTQMRSDAEIEPAFERIRAADAEAMIVLPDGLVMQHRKRIIGFAALQRIPVISGWSEFAKSGGTMTYGPNLKTVFQRLAIYVDKIFKGANPGELAIEQPTKFELVINLKAAKAIGLGVPADVARARRRGDRISRACCSAARRLCAGFRTPAIMM